MSEFKIPTEVVELPSKGLLYPKENPLSSGTIEMKYMTAREEDILTNQNYIKQGTVIDKLLQSLITSKINYEDLLIGDKNAIIIASRILSYGKDYEFNHNGVNQVVDISLLEPTKLHKEFLESSSNNFVFTLPHSENVVTFKLLTHKDEKKIEKEVKGLKKINKDRSSDVTVRLSNIITSINGSEDPKEIHDFVNNYFLAKDARAFRAFYNEVSPDINMQVVLEDTDDGEETIDLPMGVTFFWPDI